MTTQDPSLKRSNVYKALFADALYQILDNWVFRILCVLTLVPILFTFFIAFRPDEVSLLFGFKSWSYDALLEALAPMSGIRNPGLIEDAQGLVVAAFLGLVFDFLAGSIGVIFCIAATAFFVPRMIEKGAADVLFHKPVSRLALYLSRYFAGLLYIVLLSVVMVGGIYAGLAIVSGYNDPGILTAALTLTYFFGLLHAVSMLIGVVTRSTVAAILLSILFFFGNGCIHQIWITKEQLVESSRLEKLTVSGEEDEDAEVAEETGDGEEPDIDPDEIEVRIETDGEERSLFVSSLIAVLDTLHYVLPKTTDASYIAKRMRKAANKPDFRDEETAFAIYDLPPGMEAAAPAAVPAPASIGAPDDVLGERLFTARGGENTLQLWRRERRTEEYEHAGRTRTRSESLSRAAEALAAALGVPPDAGEPDRFGTSSRGSAVGAVTFRSTDGGTRHTVTVFRIGDAILTLAIADASEASADEADRTLLAQVSQKSALDLNLMERPDWYEGVLGFDSELKYNIFFSIGSSLAFTLLMLGLGWWRLRRIDF